jgi:cystathionine beta-synthase
MEKIMQEKNRYSSLLQEIGNTPLIQLNLPSVKATVLAKLEYMNPCGSIKDRSALYMIEQAEREGQLKPGGTLIEATSGNQGIALAMLGALKGYRVIITTSARTSQEKIKTLESYGAEVYICPVVESFDDPKSHYQKAKDLNRSTTNSFFINQYRNVNNANAHYKFTAPEIWEQTKGKFTHCFLCMGTCGTISGLSKYFKEKNSSIKIIGVDAEFSKISNNTSKNTTPCEIEGIGVDVISDFFDRSLVDDIIPMPNEPAFAMTRKLAREGLLVGLSSGAVTQAITQYASNFKSTDVVVTIFADSGRAYLSKI